MLRSRAGGNYPGVGGGDHVRARRPGLDGAHERRCAWAISAHATKRGMAYGALLGPGHPPSCTDRMYPSGSRNENVMPNGLFRSPSTIGTPCFFNSSCRAVASGVRSQMMIPWPGLSILRLSGDRLMAKGHGHEQRNEIQSRDVSHGCLRSFLMAMIRANISPPASSCERGRQDCSLRPRAS